MKVSAIVVGVAALAFGLGPAAAPVVPNTSPVWASDAAVEMVGEVAVPVPVPFTVDDLPEPWRRVALCESSGRVDAVGGSRGQYQGLFQIEYPRTWVAHGGDPDRSPTAATVAEQFEVALHIYEDRGWKPWPHCGKHLRKAYGR